MNSLKNFSRDPSFLLSYKDLTDSLRDSPMNFVKVPSALSSNICPGPGPSGIILRISSSLCLNTFSKIFSLDAFQDSLDARS